MKEFINKKEWIGFALNFVAVCLGIIITFAGQGLINRSAQNREVKSSLELVKNELQDNLSYIELADSILEFHAKAAKFLIRYEGSYPQAPADSMALLCNIPLTAVEITHSEEALELLKNSSLFTKIKDMELSLEIIHTYGIISDQMKMNRFYHERKGKYLEDALTEHVRSVLSQDNVTANRLWSAITSTDLGKQYLRELIRLQMSIDSSQAKEAIESTISHIDRYLR